MKRVRDQQAAQPALSTMATSRLSVLASHVAAGGDVGVATALAGTRDTSTTTRSAEL